MQLKNIHKFEQLNNICISIYGCVKKNVEDEGYAIPLKVSKDLMKEHVQLLLMENGDIYHYCWIKKFSRLNGKLGGDHKRVFYRYCIHGFCACYNINDLQVSYTEEEMAARLLDHKKIVTLTVSSAFNSQMMTLLHLKISNANCKHPI